MSAATMKWVARINGRNHMNGKRYCVTIDGEADLIGRDVTVYDALSGLAEPLQELNPEMEFPDSIQLTLVPST